MRKALVVGLTGGIGSGKSEALAAFRRLGAQTFCLDEVAHEVLGRPPVRAALARVFGPGVLGPDGGVDRRVLGRTVFASVSARRRLERLTHPAILSAMRRRIRRHRRGLLIVDAPLLFEAGLEKEFDLTAVVTAGRGTRLARLRRRDRLPLAELRRRMAAQAPLAEKARRADVVIANDSALGALRRKVRDYHRAFELIYGG